MSVDFEQFLAKVDPEKWAVGALVGLSGSVLFAGVLFSHPRKTLQILKSEGAKGITGRYTQTLKVLNQRFVNHL